MKDKKEQPEQQEKTLVIDITPTRGLLILLALVLATAACLGILAWGQKKAAASAPAGVVVVSIQLPTATYRSVILPLLNIGRRRFCSDRTSDAH